MLNYKQLDFYCFEHIWLFTSWFDQEWWMSTLVVRIWGSRTGQSLCSCSFSTVIYYYNMAIKKVQSYQGTECFAWERQEMWLSLWPESNCGHCCGSQVKCISPVTSDHWPHNLSTQLWPSYSFLIGMRYMIFSNLDITLWGESDAYWSYSLCKNFISLKQI